MSAEPPKDEPKLKRLSRKTRDEDGSFSIDEGVNIAGCLNTGAVISSGDFTAVNVGGSAVQGDIYHTMAAHIPDDIQQAIQNLEKATPEQKEKLSKAFVMLDDELDRGPEADASMVNLIMTDMLENSPEIARLAANWIGGRAEVSSEVKSLVRGLAA